MHGRNSFEDELARRRRLRERQAAAPTGEEPAASDAQEDEVPHFGWKDIVALCIAAYQILFPILLALTGAMVLAYLLFRWYFSA